MLRPLCTRAILVVVLLALSAAGTSAADTEWTTHIPFVFHEFAPYPAEMTLVHGGNFYVGVSETESFWMSPDYCEQIHTEYLEPYLIDTHEVTIAEYAHCVAAGHCEPPSENGSKTRQSYYGNPTYADYPVVYVSWDNACDYCAWLGKRLPTDDEWEKAARGTGGRKYPWGNSEPNCTLCNGRIDEDTVCVGDTTAVGSYPQGASPYGVMDMAGNVWEWVNAEVPEDWWTLYSHEDSYRVIRGGNATDNQVFLHAANRYAEHASYMGNDVGFRCALSISP